MKYMGSKNRIKKHILPIIQKSIDENGIKLYIEPFVGGCNIIDGIRSDKKYGIDLNEYLISMWNALKSGWNPPKYISKEQYLHIKEYKELYPAELVSIVGFCSTYNAKWFGGYAGIANTKNGAKRDYYTESVKNITKQIDKIKDVEFICKSYIEINDISDAVFYCDPPYKNTTSYKDEFDHDEFYNWCRKTSLNNIVFVSEYEMPEDFVCIWKKEMTTTLDKSSRKSAVEKLFIHKTSLNRLSK